MQALLRVALVGCGAWGPNLSRALSRVARTELCAVCDVDPRRLSGWPATRCFPGITELLDAPAVDAVLIATPPDTHARLALAALAAGRHVFVEKPMATSLPEALAMREGARRACRVLFVGHILAYHPACSRLIDLVQAGDLGPIDAIVSERVGASSPHGLDAWWSLAPHDVSVIRAIAGGEVQQVEACEMRRESPAPEIAACVRVAGTPTLLRIGSRGNKTRRLVVVGRRHIATFDGLGVAGGLTVRPRTASADAIVLGARGSGTAAERVASVLAAVNRVHADARNGRIVPTRAAEPLAIELERFVSAALDHTPFPTDADEGVAVVRALEAGARSLERSGAPIRVETPARQAAAIEAAAD